MFSKTNCGRNDRSGGEDGDRSGGSGGRIAVSRGDGGEDRDGQITEKTVATVAMATAAVAWWEWTPQPWRKVNGDCGDSGRERLSLGRSA